MRRIIIVEKNDEIRAFTSLKKVSSFLNVDYTLLVKIFCIKKEHSTLINGYHIHRVVINSDSADPLI